jgi:transposase
MAARSLKAQLKKACPTWNVLRARLVAKGHNMSRTTVRRFAEEHGGHSASTLIKPPLSAETKAKRLFYAKKLAKRSPKAWRNVVFLDEAACAPITTRRVIILRGQSSPIKHIDRRAQKLHFMGYISGAGKKSKLHFLEPGVTWTSANLAPLIRGLKQPGVEVVLDGASPHRRLKADLEKAGAVVLPHPPYSPDLNPIENIWAVLKAKAAVKEPRTHEELKKALEDAWAELTPTRFRAFADSMQRRMQLVVESGGEHTRY